jgi:Rad3-related DNA helicase
VQADRFTSVLDGTGRAPFPLQLEFLEWLPQQKARVIAAQLPTGIGKSFIIRTIMRATGALATASSNMLLGQYEDVYPELNTLKGAAHYRCEDRKISCGDARDLELPACKGCPYRTCRKAALEGAPTLFNPMSLYALTADQDFQRPRTTAVDEAHALPGMLMLVAGERFSASKFRLPASTNSLDVLEWLAEQIPKVRRVAEHFAQLQKGKEALSALKDHERLVTVYEGLQASPQNYVIYRAVDKYRNEDCLHVRPLSPPKPLIERVLGTGRIILLSATLSRVDAELLAPGEEIAYFDARSPIPVKQRQIYYRPMPFTANSRTDPSAVAAYVVGILDENPGNALVHATYAMAERLAAALRKIGVKAFANTSDTKDACISRFKKDGGVFVAAGCADGLNLPDDECRVNIIPILPRADPTAPEIQKWLALPGGRRRYDLETMQKVQQMAGRSTRHLTDHSKVFIGDGQFSNTYGRVAKELPQSFREAIVWTKGGKG